MGSSIRSLYSDKIENPLSHTGYSGLLARSYDWLFSINSIPEETLDLIYQNEYQLYKKVLNTLKSTNSKLITNILPLNLFCKEITIPPASKINPIAVNVGDTTFEILGNKSKEIDIPVTIVSDDNLFIYKLCILIKDYSQNILNFKDKFLKGVAKKYSINLNNDNEKIVVATHTFNNLLIKEVGELNYNSESSLITFTLTLTDFNFYLR